MTNGIATTAETHGRYRSVTLSHLAQGWISAAAPYALAKRLRLSASVDPTLPVRLTTDPEALSRIAAELLTNAIRFTKSGDIVMTLDHRGSALALTICDTGIGISPSLTVALLSGEQTIETAPLDGTSRRTSGIATVQRLTRLLGGSIELHSSLGKGTTITVLVPLAHGADGPTRP
jgi:signal transduction histidine kinase